jgi:hypothetical protein
LARFSLLLLRLVAVHFLVTALNLPAAHAAKTIAAISTGNQCSIIERLFVRATKARSVRGVVLNDLSVSDARRFSEAR